MLEILLDAGMDLLTQWEKFGRMTPLSWLGILQEGVACGGGNFEVVKNVVAKKKGLDYLAQCMAT